MLAQMCSATESTSSGWSSAASSLSATASACGPAPPSISTRELVASDPRQHGLARPTRLARPDSAPRDPLEHQVAELVPERVVDRLEVVEVEQHHRHRMRSLATRRRRAPPGASRTATSDSGGRLARRGGRDGWTGPPAGRRSTPRASARSTPGRAPRWRRRRRAAPARTPARSRRSTPGRPDRRAGSREAADAPAAPPPTHASTWLVTKNAAAGGQHDRQLGAVIGPSGSRVSDQHTPPAATIASTYCAALNRILSGDTRAGQRRRSPSSRRRSAPPDQAPNRSRIANANAAEIVTRASPRRRGTGIGSSSPASTNTDRTTNSAGSLDLPLAAPRAAGSATRPRARTTSAYVQSEAARRRSLARSDALRHDERASSDLMSGGVRDLENAGRPGRP